MKTVRNFGIGKKPPREGSHLRVVYDLAKSGQAINPKQFQGRTRQDLEDYHYFWFLKESTGVWRAVEHDGIPIYPQN